MPSFPVEGLTRASARILEAADAPPDIAAKVAGWLADANLSGHPSHGFIRIPMYAERIRQGLWIPDERPEVTQESDTSVLIDGRAGFGFLAAELLTRKLAEKAKAQHVAVGGIIRCTHIGRLGQWGEMAVEMGVAYLMGTGTADSTQGGPFRRTRAAPVHESADVRHAGRWRRRHGHGLRDHVRCRGQALRRARQGHPVA